jgi:hypothetical protein
MNEGQVPPDAATQEVTCGYIRDISTYGTAVIAAAGVIPLLALVMSCLTGMTHVVTG